MSSSNRPPLRVLIALGVGGVLLVAAIVGVVLYIEHRQIQASLDGPASLEDVIRVSLAGGGDALLVTTKVMVETGGEDSASSYQQYGLLVVEPATGRVMARRWWETRHDQPRCQAHGPGRIACTSTEHKAIHVRDLATLEEIESASPPARVERPRNTCISHRTSRETPRLELVRITGSRRMRVTARAADAAPRECDLDVLEGGFLCDHARGETLVLPRSPPAMLLTDLGSTIVARQTLSLIAIDTACKVVWREQHAAGRLVFATVIGERAIVGIARGRPTEAKRSEVLAHDASGAIVWRLPL